MDAEFDFNESFWRFELSLARHADANIQSPNDRLLEVQSDTSPSQFPPPIEDPVARLQSFLASNSRRNSFSNPGLTGDEGVNMGDSSLREMENLLNLESTNDNNGFPFPWLFGDALGPV